MASEKRIKDVAALYVTIFKKTPTISDLDMYLNLSSSIKIETISSMMMATSPLKSTLLSQDLTTIVKEVFQSIFGYTDGQMNTIIAQQQANALNGGTDGFQYWVNELQNNADMINVNTLAIALLNGADATTYARAVNLSEVKSTINNYAKEYNLTVLIEEYVDNNPIPETSETPETPETPEIPTTPTDNSNINIGKAIYVESKISTDDGNDGSIDWVTNFTYSYENEVLNKFSGEYLQTKYVYDSNGNIIEERSMDDGVVDTTAYYTYNSIGQLLTMRDGDGGSYSTNGTYTWSSNGVVLNGTMSYMGMSVDIKGVGTGLNNVGKEPLKWEQYLDDELESISYFTYDSNGNLIKELEDEDADGTIDYAYHTEWILLG